MLVAAIGAALLWPHGSHLAGLDDKIAAEWRPWWWLLVGGASAHCLNRGLTIFVWEGIVCRQTGHPAPRILADMVAALVWLLALLSIFTFVFGQSPAILITMSSVVMGVAGFSLKNLLADLFAGIALSLERPFTIGDWIEVDSKGTHGKIVQMNWRAVSTVTINDVTVSVPNSWLTTNSIQIHSRPKPYYRDEILITLPYAVTTQQAQRILLGSANQIEEIAALPKKSIVSIADYTDRGVLWRLLFWMPDMDRLARFRFLVHQNILHNLRIAGINIPVPVRDYRKFPSAEPQDISHLLNHVSLFSGLESDDLHHLSVEMLLRICPAGEPILHQGDAGDSLFILSEGLLSVYIATPDGLGSKVGQINPGSFFGELSLLTGAPRSATVVPFVDSVVAEIGKDSMSHLLAKRPMIAAILSEALAEHQYHNAKEGLAHQPLGEEKGANAKSIFDKIQRFFAL